VKDVKSRRSVVIFVASRIINENRQPITCKNNQETQEKIFKSGTTYNKNIQKLYRNYTIQKLQYIMKEYTEKMSTMLNKACHQNNVMVKSFKIAI